MKLVKNLPNIFSVIRIPLGITFLFVFSRYAETAIVALVILGFSLLSDFLDGFLARKANLVSELGKWLDPVSDFLFFFFVYLSFVLNGLMPVYLFFIFMTRELIMYSVIRPNYYRKKMESGAKMPGKIKTFLQGVGVVVIVLFSYFVKLNLMSLDFFTTFSNILLHVLVIYSFVSLYWYIRVFFSIKDAKEKI